MSSAPAAALEELRSALVVPKVAVLFLTPGPLAHEGLWTDWVAQSVGMVPAKRLQELLKEAPDGEAQAHLRHLLDLFDRGIRHNTGLRLLDRQLLFSFYTHTHPDFKGYKAGSVFEGTIVPGRIVALRSHHSLIEAERILLQEALRDPLNRRFILVSETHVPLYPGVTLHSQLMAENVSRVDGCFFASQYHDNLDRWHPHMSSEQHWRKTSQWFSLMREHAQIVVDDVEMNAEFAEHCHPRFGADKWGNERWISCSDNEHYIGVLLAAKQEGHATACWPGGTTYVDWTHMTDEGRPMSFTEAEMSQAFFSRARMSQCNFVSCEPSCATPTQVLLSLLTSKHLFVDLRQLRADGDSVAAYTALVPHKNVSYVPLDPKCSLLLRKVHGNEAAHVRGVLQDFLKPPDLTVTVEHLENLP